MALSKAEIACYTIINTLKISKLAFCVQETPYSAYITIRKEFSQKLDFKVEPQNSAHKQKVDPSETLTPESDVTEALKKQNEVLLKTIDNLKSKIEYEVGKHKALIDEKLVYIKNVEHELDTSEKNWKTLNKELKAKSKETHDLTKENCKVKEDLDAYTSELASLKAKINKERKEADRKIKKDKKSEALSNLKSESRYKCEKCNENFENISQLKSHEQFHHMKTSTTQTEEIPLLGEATIEVDRVTEKKMFEVEPTKTASAANFDDTFQKHTKPGDQESLFESNLYKPPDDLPKNCSFANLPIGFPLKSHYLPNFSYPIGLSNFLPPLCEYCGWQAGSEIDLVNHKKDVHGDLGSCSKFKF